MLIPLRHPRSGNPVRAGKRLLADADPRHTHSGSIYRQHHSRAIAFWTNVTHRITSLAQNALLAFHLSASANVDYTFLTIEWIIAQGSFFFFPQCYGISGALARSIFAVHAAPGNSHPASAFSSLSMS